MKQSEKNIAYLLGIGIGTAIYALWFFTNNMLYAVEVLK